MVKIDEITKYFTDDDQIDKSVQEVFGEIMAKLKKEMSNYTKLNRERTTLKNEKKKKLLKGIEALKKENDELKNKLAKPIKLEKEVLEKCCNSTKVWLTYSTVN